MTAAKSKKYSEPSIFQAVASEWAAAFFIRRTRPLPLSTYRCSVRKVTLVCTLPPVFTLACVTGRKVGQLCRIRTRSKKSGS